MVSSVHTIHALDSRLHSSLPMPLTVIVPFTKPECWLTAVLWLFAYDLVRPPALLLSIFFVLYGAAHAILQPYVTPFTMEALLEQMKEDDPETAEKMSKFAPPKRSEMV